MLEITKSATDKIAELLKDKEVTAIRIFLNAGGCGGPGVAMALDEPKDTDTVFDTDGFQFIVDEDFLGEAAPIKVDYNTRSGFQFDCSLDFEDECTACETSGCCC
jgi:Fe-S cluster assembly iron-binding protein IscA